MALCKYRFIFLFVVTNFNYAIGFNQESLENIFKDEECIEGKIRVSDSGQAFIDTSIVEEKIKVNLVEAPILSNTKTHLLVDLKTSVQNDKTVLSLLYEVAQLNDVSTQFTLIKEEGLPHEREFFIRLDLGDETYFASASSIKKAQYAAAHQALEKTQLEKPVKGVSPEKIVEKLTPTVQLNNIAAKLGIKIQYINEISEGIDENDLMEVSHTTNNYYSLDQSSKSYISKLNKSITHRIKKTVKGSTGEKQEQGPFRVRVIVGEDIFLGTGVTIQAARHDAAINALESFKKMSLKDAEQCIKRGEVCNKLGTKSPISMVFEIGTIRGLPVNFNLLEESGPDHKKEFVMECRVGDLVTKAEGPSKKKSKNKVAEKMLEKLNDQEALLPGSAIRVNDKKKKKKKKNKIARGALANIKINAADAVSSVFTALGGSSNEDSFEDISDDSNEDSGIKKFKKELLKLGNDIGIGVDFSTFSTNDDRHATLVSLKTDPSYICYGKDVTSEQSEENASLNAIKFIKQVGLDNIVIPLTNRKEDVPKIILDTKRQKLDVWKSDL